MNKRRRQVLWALPLVVFWVAGFLFYCLVKAPLPVEDGCRELAGLRSGVHVDFDELGIPRVTAENAADAFHALGFVTAGDRLFQMDLLRRKTAGRLAEIFGENARPGNRSSDGFERARFDRNVVAPTCSKFAAKICPCA